MQKPIVLIGLLLVSACLAQQPMLFVWPQPASFTLGNTTLSISKDVFIFEIAPDTKPTSVLTEAFARQAFSIFENQAVAKYIDEYAGHPPEATRSLVKLVVSVASEDDSLYLGVDESYNLTIPADQTENVATLKANTIYGALHGLETFSQLVQYDGKGWLIANAPIVISDKPRFPWRGLLVDTSRHYHPLWSIKHIIDAMTYAKLNVLHWHITDAESFGLELESRPELSKKGAWDTGFTYSATDVLEIIQYAKKRGIRVVPEIDTPGHTYSWGYAYPEIILNCTKRIFRGGYPGINNVPLDMTNPTTYEVVKDVYQEAAAIFTDDYLHVGGDEVSSRCIDEFPRIKEWMQQHNMSTDNYSDLLRYFRVNLTSYITAVNKKMVVWQEAYEEMLVVPENPLRPENTIVQVWENEDAAKRLETIIRSGFRAIVSAGWYLDQQVPSVDRKTHYLYQDTWLDFYSREPTANVSATPDQLNLIIGGETCQWGESSHPYNIDGSVWARAAATAERLWSPKEVNDEKTAYYRLIRFQCHILQRGVRTSPFRPNHCPSPILDALAAPRVPSNVVDNTVHVPLWLVVASSIVFVIAITSSIGMTVRLCCLNTSRSKYDRV